MSLRILVVEDNPDYMKACQEYMKDVQGTQVYAADFVSADEALLNGAYDGAISDCFFPFSTGTNHIAKGREAVRKMMKTPVGRSLAKVEGILGTSAALHIGKNARAGEHPEGKYFDALMRAMLESEHNQPLGMLVAEMLDERGVPFVLATSTYHHDELTQPICNYAAGKHWTVIDCPQDAPEQKATPEFWERAFAELRRKI